VNTRKEMEASIRGGQGVWWNNRLITDPAKLPTQAEIDAFHASNPTLSPSGMPTKYGRASGQVTALRGEVAALSSRVAAAENAGRVTTLETATTAMLARVDRLLTELAARVVRLETAPAPSIPAAPLTGSATVAMPRLNVGIAPHAFDIPVPGARPGMVAFVNCQTPDLLDVLQGMAATIEKPDAVTVRVRVAGTLPAGSRAFVARVIP